MCYKPMGIFLNLFRVLIVSLLTASCSAVVCIDSHIEREPVPVKDEWVFTVTFLDKDSQKYTLKCEKYYDSMCAARGNSWQVREVGKSTSNRRSYFDIEGTELKLELPTCSEIIKSKEKLSMSDISIVWNIDGIEKNEYGSKWLGERYRYISTDDGMHSFKRGGLEIVKFAFSLDLNGAPIN